MFKLKTKLSLFTKIRTKRDVIQQSTVETFKRIEKRVEGTMAENWLRFWKHLLRDYIEVAVDVAKESRQKPTKAILIGGTAGLFTYFAKHNPDEVHFKDTFLQATNDCSIVHHSLVNEQSAEHLKFIQKCYNGEVLRCTSYLFFSLVWVDSNSSNCNIYETECPYLQLGYLDVLKRTVDVGFLDTWWVLAKKMTDYDVNF